MTQVNLPALEQLVALCQETSVSSGVVALENALQALLGDAGAQHMLSRGGWHRLGGVVDGDLNRISDNLFEWAQANSDEDLVGLQASYMDSGYLVTHFSGKTHYFALPVGDKPEDFVQIEIEELQEVVVRPLVMDDWYPETLEEFVDPVDYEKLDPQPVGAPCYLFRRMTPVAMLPRRMNPQAGGTQNLWRFFEDWGRSSASELGLFCRHWVLAIREYQDSDGEARVTVRPLSTFNGELPHLPQGERLQGGELAGAIHAYDRELGYSFAWYFNLICRKAENYALAIAVLNDQVGAYDYLPARDLKVLRAWEERPYSV